MKNFKKLIYIFLFLIILFASPTKLIAADISGHWAEVDLLELNARGIIKLKEITPDDYVTRAEFTKMVVDCLGLRLEALKLQGAPTPFTDVSKGHPLKGYILAAKERGLVSGYSEEIFKPEEILRRDQMIVLLLRVMGIDDIEVKKECLKFKDVKEIPDYALASISEGVRLGLVKGYEDNTFRPAEKVTLAQAAAFINRWLELKGDRYDYIGHYKSIDPEKKELVMSINENIINLPVSKDLTVLIEGKLNNIKNLKEDDLIAVKLNVIGKIVLIHKKNIGLSEVKVNIDTRKLPKLKIQKETGFLQESGLFNPRLPANLENISESILTTKTEINLPALVSAAGTDGRGKVVAVIDTGVDPSHPDLAVTTDNKPKIIDWVDFTLEGVVNTTSVFPLPETNIINWENQDYHIGDVFSLSGSFRLGYLNIKDFVPLELLDFEATEELVPVLLVDTTEKGVYDTVYIDVNRDNSFANEKALKIFRENRDYVLLPYKGKELALVIVDIDSQGKYVQLANDISGHGTHVAGIIAANGQLQGVAPGAQIMVLKAVDRDGYADPANIIEAIRYAAIHGAHIINISLGQYQDVLPGKSKLSQIVDEVVENYGVVVITAAGNTGPGINTVASPADALNAISVGAFVSPKMWEIDFGYNVSKDSLYYFSSIGPRRDGAWYPTIIAPGSAVSTVPRWMESPYMLTEGTSMAAPHVSGVIAHLLQGAENLGLKTTPALIKRVIEEGARDIEEFTVVEDGHGVLDAYGAWLKLKEIKEERKITAVLYSPEYGIGPGVYAREYIPHRLKVKLINNDNKKDYFLQWSSTEPWLKSEFKSTYLMRGGSQRDIAIILEVPDKPGFYSGVLKGDDPKVPGLEVEVPVNIIIGEEIYNQRPYIFTTLGSLDPAHLARHFVKVPEGTSEIKAVLEIFPDTSGNYEGRGRLHLINPYGLEEGMSDYAGLAPFALARKNEVEVRSYNPEAGTWEIVVYSSASLSAYNVEKTKYQLTVTLGDIINIDTLIPPERDIIVSPIPEKVLKKTKGTIVLHLWDKKNKKPFIGALEINGRFYEIENGRVEYDVNKIKAEKRIRLTIVK